MQRNLYRFRSPATFRFSSYNFVVQDELQGSWGWSGPVLQTFLAVALQRMRQRERSVFFEQYSRATHIAGHCFPKGNVSSLHNFMIWWHSLPISVPVTSNVRFCFWGVWMLHALTAPKKWRGTAAATCTLLQWVMYNFRLWRSWCLKCEGHLEQVIFKK